MKRIIKLLSFLLISTLLMSLNLQKIEEDYSLTIIVKNLQNSTGAVQFALYNKEGSIPDQKFRKYYRKLNASIIDRKSEITFNDLPQGVYAVTILHDENNNGKIDKKFMLPLPNEGVGFSNYEDFGLSNRPNFKNASFNLEKDITMEVIMIYK